MYECDEILEPVLNGRKFHIKYLLAYDKISFREWLKVMNDLDYQFVWLGKNWCSFRYAFDETDICIIYTKNGNFHLSWYKGLVGLPVLCNDTYNRSNEDYYSFRGFVY